MRYSLCSGDHVSDRLAGRGGSGTLEGIAYAVGRQCRAGSDRGPGQRCKQFPHFTSSLYAATSGRLPCQPGYQIFRGSSGDLW